MPKGRRPGQQKGENSAEVGGQFTRDGSSPLPTGSGPTSTGPAPSLSPDGPAAALQKWLARRLGPRLALVAICLLMLWSSWPSIRQSPGIQAVAEWCENQLPLPRATPGKFTIALTHLGGDVDSEVESLVATGLSELRGIHLLRLKRTIRLAPEASTTEVKRAESRARQWLTDSGADVVVWGPAIRANGKVVPKLFVSPRPPDDSADQLKRFPLDGETLALPAIFWSDLAYAAKLAVLQAAKPVLMRDGLFPAEQTDILIAKAKDLLSQTKPGTGWSSEGRSQLRLVIAMGLGRDDRS